MNCEEAWNLISARMDGEISPEDRPALDAHLAACATCRSVSDGFEVDDSRLRRAFVERRRAAAAVAGFLAAVLVFRPFGEREGDRVVEPTAPAPAVPADPAPRSDSAVSLGRLTLVAGAKPGSAPGAVEVEDGGRWRALGND